MSKDNTLLKAELEEMSDGKRAALKDKWTSRRDHYRKMVLEHSGKAQAVIEATTSLEEAEEARERMDVAYDRLVAFVHEYCEALELLENTHGFQQREE